MAAMVSPELRAFLSNHLRLRHIHIPDCAPLYAPRYLVPNLRDHLEYQITEQRLRAADWALNGEHNAGTSADLADEIRSWLRRAGPPPTVLSWTRRPTYVMPKHHMAAKEPWEIDYLSSSLKGKMHVTFPEPPGWSSLPWRPSWQQDAGSKPWLDDPLDHSWEPGVLVMPCAEPMYFGPGQLQIWPVIDVLDHLQQKMTITTKHQFERILEDTTINVLQRAYGITAFAIAGSPGVYVESAIPPGEVSPFNLGPGDPIDSRLHRRHNTRRIATVHADFVNNITRFGVSIHVGAPTPVADAWTATNNPWSLLRQQRSTTSVAAELAHRYPDTIDGLETKIRYLHTRFNPMKPSITQTSLQAMPYSLVLVEPGRRMPAPLGMDNRDLSTAWTYEFARQLGMHEGTVDHFGVVDHRSASEIPLRTTPTTHLGFTSRPVAEEDGMTEPYSEFKAPEIQLLEAGQVTKRVIRDTQRIEIKDGRLNKEIYPVAISWPMYWKALTNVLHESIHGSARENRLSKFLWKEEKGSSRMLRHKILKETLIREDQWRIEPKSAPTRRPSADSIVEKLTGNALAMLQILSILKVGGPRKDALVKRIAKTRTILMRDMPSKNRLKTTATAAQELRTFLHLIQTAQDSLDEAAEMIFDSPAMFTEDGQKSLGSTLASDPTSTDVGGHAEATAVPVHADEQAPYRQEGS